MDDEAGFRADGAPVVAVDRNGHGPTCRRDEGAGTALSPEDILRLEWEEDKGLRASMPPLPMSARSGALRSPRPASGDDRPGSDKPDTRRESPRRRVPDCDIIDVGRRPARPVEEPVDVRDLAPVGLAARVTTAQDGASADGKLTRSLLVLIALAVAAFGGIHLSRRITAPQVIFVPATLDENSVIT